MLAPLPQDQAYHRFADSRAFLGVDNAADVLSNFAFLVVGVMGLLLLWRGRAESQRFSTAEEMWPYWVFFCAVALTAFGSAYYHLAPDDARLVWDRLPMSVAFMALVAAVLAERVDVKLGVKLLFPLAVIGVATVLYWASVDDLRPYLLVQYGSIAAVLALSALFPSRYTRGEMIFAAAALYAVAKVLEAQDRAVFEFTGGGVSGHTLKHLLAATALYLVLWSVQRRMPRQRLISRPS
jgi:hypothetical protein